MRYLYFASISLSLVLFLCNHAHARIGQTYEYSVVKYEQAGFSKERTYSKTPRGGTPVYAILPSRRGGDSAWATELTWTNNDPDGKKQSGIVSITQVFYGEGPPTNKKLDPLELLKCIDIEYKFKDGIDIESEEFKYFVSNLTVNAPVDSQVPTHLLYATAKERYKTTLVWIDGRNNGKKRLFVEISPRRDDVHFRVESWSTGVELDVRGNTINFSSYRGFRRSDSEIRDVLEEAIKRTLKMPIPEKAPDDLEIKEELLKSAKEKWGDSGL